MEDPLFDAALAQTALAVVLVAIYSWFRYNTPKSVRSETTWSKFLLGRIAYVAIVLGTFLVLLVSPGILDSLLGELKVPGGTQWLNERRTSVGFPLILALGFTLFLSEVPGLSRLDGSVRGYFHHIASIPKERRARIALLWSSKLADDPDVHADAARKLKPNGVTGSDFVLDGIDSPQALLTRLAIHTVCLERLAQSRKYCGYLLESKEYEELRSAYGRLASKAEHVFPLLREGTGGKADRLLREAFMEEAQRLLTRYYDLMSRLILNCDRTERQRQTCIGSLGLQPQRKKQEDVIHQVLWLLLLLVVFLMLSLGNLGSLTAAKILAIALAQVSAVVIALAVQAATPSSDGMRVPPLGRYLLSGGLAFTAWASLMGTFELVAGGEVIMFLKSGRATALSRLFQERWAWGLMTVGIAILVFALTDDWTETRVRRLRDRFDLGRWVNLLDGLIMALGMAGTAYFLVHPNLATARLEGWVIALIASGVGWLLGLLVPTAFRRRVRDVLEEEAERASSKAEGSLLVTQM